jgi:outer membrane protein OmpA-like peptidoglycan-associated protein
MKKFALALMIAGILAGCAVPEKEKKSRIAVVPIRDEESKSVLVVPIRSSPPSQEVSYVASEQFFLCQRKDMCPVPRQSFTERFFFPKMPKPIREEPIMRQYESLKGDLSGPMMTTVYFDQDDARLTEAGSKILDGMFDQMKKIDPMRFRIVIAGYTDGSGPKENNAKLAEDRAKTVSHYFIEKGISEERITAGGLPLCCYVASNDTEEGRARNRRAEVFIEPFEEEKGEKKD